MAGERPHPARRGGIRYLWMVADITDEEILKNLLALNLERSARPKEL
jgi:hypothetical protein